MNPKHVVVTCGQMYARLSREAIQARMAADQAEARLRDYKATLFLSLNQKRLDRKRMSKAELSLWHDLRQEQLSARAKAEADTLHRKVTWAKLKI